MGLRVLCAVAAAVGLVIAGGSSAQAEVIDFEDIYFVPFGPYAFHEDGFVIETPPGSNPVGAPLACFPACISSGSKAIYALDGGIFTFSREDGLPFSLVSIEAAPLYAGYSLTLELNFSAVRAAGGAVAQTIVDPGRNSFAPYFLDPAFANITQFTLTGGSEGLSKFFAFDNVVLGAAVSGAVPEPAAWLLMILGFGAAGAALRRRHADQAGRRA
jgi:hypothetical protein